MKKLNPLNNLAVIFCIGIATLACEKDNKNEDTNQDLQGTWNVTSWTHGGDEQIGGILASSYVIEFDSLSGTGGYSIWTITNFTGFETVIEGDYDVKDDGETLVFEGQDWQLDLNGDDLRIEGTILNESYVLMAERQ